MPGRTARPARRDPARPGSALPAAAPVYVFSREAARRLDRRASEEFAIPGLVLMENAASHVAAAALDLLASARARSVLVVAGKGHNGGDGLAAARHLHNAGVPVAVLLTDPPGAVTGDARTQLAIAVRMGLDMLAAEPPRPLDAFDALLGLLARHAGGGARPASGVQAAQPPGVIIDAMLGTGLRGPVAAGSLLATLAGAINRQRARGARVLAVDLPSGLDADTGRGLIEGLGRAARSAAASAAAAANDDHDDHDDHRASAARAPAPAPAPAGAVEADLTVTMAGLKRGFASLDAHRFLGDVLIADLGLPRRLLAEEGEPVDLASPPRRGGGGRRPRAQA